MGMMAGSPETIGAPKATKMDLVVEKLTDQEMVDCVETLFIAAKRGMGNMGVYHLASHVESCFELLEAFEEQFNETKREFIEAGKL